MTAYYNEIDPHCAQWLWNLIEAGEIAAGVVDERDIRDVTPGELMGYSQCHFFAGIGGWARALRLAGWPDDRPVWTGSCPCQGFSAAGRGGGFADERHLWPYWFHLIRVCRPPIVFGEQVASKAALEWLDLVYDDLEGEGYAVGAADLCAAGVGAFHIRQRLWFVAQSECPRPPSKQVIWQPGKTETSNACPSSGNVLLGHASDQGLPPCECETLAGKGRGQEGGTVEQSGGASIVMADTPECRSGAGLCDSGPGEVGRDEFADRGRHFWSSAVWLPCRDGKYRPTQPGLLPLAHGLSADMGCLRPGEDSPFRVIKDPKTGKSRGQAPWRVGMLKGYGNAIVPEVAAEFIRACKGEQNAEQDA